MSALALLLFDHSRSDEGHSSRHQRRIVHGRAIRAFSVSINLLIAGRSHAVLTSSFKSIFATSIMSQANHGLATHTVDRGSMIWFRAGPRSAHLCSIRRTLNEKQIRAEVDSGEFC